MNFALPGCRSNFSLLWGTASPEQLVKRAGQDGLEYLGLADDDNLYGAIDFYHLCRDAGIVPLVGVRLSTGLGKLHLIAQSHAGYQNLCRLVTARQLEGSVSAEKLARCHHDLFCLIADAAHLSALREIFGASLFWSVQGDESRRLYNVMQEQAVHPVADPTVSFIARDDYQTHLLLRAIDAGVLIDNLPDTMHDRPDGCFPANADMQKRFAQMPEAVVKGLALARRCRLTFPERKNLLPSFPDAQPDHAALLRHKALSGLREKRNPIPAAYQARLDFEAEVIDRTGFVDYFLIVAGIIDHCHQNGIPVVGRGSAAGSLTAFALGITQVDPIRESLYFERFLNEARSDPPDIDLDIDWRRRDDVLNYVYEQYGRERTAMIASYTRFRARLAVREVAKAHGLPPDEIDRLAKRLPYGADPHEIAQALRKLPPASRATIDLERYGPIIREAVRLDGFPRHLGIHPGGIVITPAPLTDYVALEWAAKGIVVTQCDMYQAEKFGLVKVDILGQRGQAVIVDCQRQVSDPAKKPFAVPDDDPATYRLLQSGKTIGVFQIESPGLRALLRDLRPTHLDDVTLALALIRPGASDSGMKKAFLERHHGGAAVAYPHPLLESILRDTFGVFIYQEQVLLCARDVAGFNLPAADLLRRAITKGRHDTDYTHLRERFIRGAAKNGVSDATASDIFHLLSLFAGFGFCKAHAATYGYLAYQSAYFKTHYPAIFMQAVLNNGGGYYPASVYIAEARRLGLDVRPPDINRSEVDESLDGNRLYVGLGRVKDLPQSTIGQILAARPFVSFDDFLARVRLSAAEAENLVKVGAFDGVEPNRPLLLWRLRLAAKRGTRLAAADNGHARPATDMFAGQLIVPQARRLPRLANLTPMERFRYEQEILGFPAGDHPLALFPAYRPTPLAWERENGAPIAVDGWLADIKRIKTREKKEAMVFPRPLHARTAWEDMEATFEVVLFPAKYKEYAELVRQYRFLHIDGVVNRDGGTVAIIGETISPAPTGLPEKPYL